MIKKAEVLFNEVQEALSQISAKAMGAGSKGSTPNKIKLSLEELAGLLEERKKEYKVACHATYTLLDLRRKRVACAWRIHITNTHTHTLTHTCHDIFVFKKMHTWLNVSICVIDILIVEYQPANKDTNGERHTILHLYLYTFHVSAYCGCLFLHYTHSLVLACAEKGI